VPACVCVCVLVNPILQGPNVHKQIVIPVIFYLVCLFWGGWGLVPISKIAYKSCRMLFFEKVKVQNAFCGGGFRVRE